MNTVITPEELYSDYHIKVARYISAHIKNEHDREDLLHQVFLKAISSLDKYDPSRSAPGTWLYAITRNAVTDYYREKAHEPVPVALDESAILPDKGYDHVFMQDTLEALASALEQLPERERNIIIYRFYHGLSAQETAKLIGVSYANERFLQHSALKKLRQLLDENELFEY